MSDDLLREFRDAVARRSKSLKHTFRQVDLEEIVDRADGQGGLQLSATALRAGKVPVLRLQVWADRWAWFDARQAGSPGGWKWVWTTDGYVKSGRSARELIDAFQSSLTYLPQNEERAAEIWSGVLTCDIGGRRKVHLARSPTDRDA